MPAFGTPSILQQRVILVAFVAFIAAVVSWQNAGHHAPYAVQKFSTTSVSDAGNELDFTMAETAWSTLQIDSQGHLKIDALTETALLDAVNLIREHPSESSMARMAFLLEKQFGTTASRQIMDLLPKLQRYKETEQRWLAEKGGINPPPYAELFQLQDELLGEALAKKMFSEQRRLAKMMLASQQIRSDARLTQTQKDQALIDLQKSLQSEGAEVE